MNEASARQLILAEAIETADSEGRLLSATERDQVDRQARQEAMQHDGERGTMASEDFLQLRARCVLAAAGVKHPELLGLQTAGVWARWLEWLLPLAAFFIGVATDAIGNPHRVDLVSLPLLGIVVWNLAVYLAILVGALWPRRSAHRTWLAQIARWTDGSHALRRVLSDLEAQIAIRFRARWFQATQALQLQRGTRLLHLCAAAWAAGVIASLLVRGLVVEYRVGWESTFLGPQQVYDILSVLRLPALLVAPFGTFTVDDVAQLRFSGGTDSASGAAWVWMYVSLLVVVVIVPRLALAAWASWRENRLERRVPIDLQDAYYQRVVSLLQSTRVQLALLVPSDEHRDRLLRVMSDNAEALPTVVSTDFGDVLRLVEVPAIEPPATPPALTGPAAWWTRWRDRLGLGSGVRVAPGDAQLAQLKDDCDLVVHVRRDDEREVAMLRWLDKPVLEIDMGSGQGLPVGSIGRCWIQDTIWLDAIALRLPEGKQAGFARIARTWQERNEQKLKLAMNAAAEHLVFAARQVEEIHSSALTVKNLLPSQRQAQTNARQSAMDVILQRLDESAAAMVSELHRIHGLDQASREAIEHRLEERFVVQQPVDASQAGMAGAATGAAMGASVDLLAGGLTLGAAAALGAALGGGAAYIAAAWKNRATPAGATLVQLSDEMLEALVDAALLRYLAVAHWSRGRAEIDEGWKAQVAVVLADNRPLLSGYWNGARGESSSQRIVEPLSRTLVDMAHSVLRRIYLI